MTGLVTAFLLAAAAHAAKAPPPAPLEESAYGVLLLGEGEGREWPQLLDSVRKELGPAVPFAFAPGRADGRVLQKAVDQLEARRVRTIVGVPLFISSYGDVMDQNRYLFGIRERPADSFTSVGGTAPPAPRLKTRQAALVLTRALDDNALVADILAERARSLGRRPAQECLALVGESPVEEAPAREWSALAAGIAEKARQAAGFRQAASFGLAPAAPQAEREKREQELRSALRRLARDCPVIAVPLALETGALQQRARRALDGVFVRWDGRPLLPDPRLAVWVRQSAAAGARLPDMRAFKDDARKPAGPPKLSPIPRPGEKR